MKQTKNQLLAQRIYDIHDRIQSKQSLVTQSYSTSLKNGVITHSKNDNPLTISYGYAQSFLTVEDVKAIKMNLSHRIFNEISTELKMNNPLWQCKELHKSQVREAIKELEGVGILLRIRKTDIFYICADKLCKGKQLNVTYGLVYYMEQRKLKITDVTANDIKNLKSPPSGYAIPFNFKKMF